MRQLLSRMAPARYRRLLILLPFLVVGSLLVLHMDDVWTVHLRDLGYITRPIWDRAPKRFSHVYGVDRMLVSRTWVGTASPISDVNDIDWERVCSAHQLRPLASLADYRKTRVVDAVLFSVELDLLELRMRELWDVVDIFLVAEARLTFSGQPKPLLLKENLHRFEWAKKKLVYHTVDGLHVAPLSADGAGDSGTLAARRGDGQTQQTDITKREDPMENEIRMRASVTRALDSMRLGNQSLVIMSDVDEIPSREAIGLLRSCDGWGEAVHLGMPTYMYSFEYPLARQPSKLQLLEGIAPGQVDGEGLGHGPRQWRTTVKRYTPGKTIYTHSRVSDTIFERAGWHCSFCFPYISDFVFKMTSYSHNDRVTNDRQLSPVEIQNKICSGRDVFDMYAEAYDFASLVRFTRPISNTTDVDSLPEYLLDHQNEFRYLLPGGCIRRKRPI